MTCKTKTEAVAGKVQSDASFSANLRGDGARGIHLMSRMTPFPVIDSYWEWMVQEEEELMVDLQQMRIGIIKQVDIVVQQILKFLCLQCGNFGKLDA